MGVRKGGGTMQNSRGSLVQKSGVSIALPEMNRTIPKVMHKDKERLYDEALKLKANNNTVRDENLRLRTRVKVLENELHRKERLLEEFSLQPVEGKDGKPKSDIHLTGALKRQVKELRAEASMKQEEIQKLRRNLKATRLNEYEIELKMFADECTRLRHMLEGALRNKDPLTDPVELARIEEHFQH